MSIRTTWSIVKETFNNFTEHRALTQGAALAYYALFSIGPLLVIIVGVAGLVFNQEAAGQQLTQQIQGLVGENAARTIQSMMASQQRGDSLLAATIGIVLLLLGASG